MRLLFGDPVLLDEGVDADPRDEAAILAVAGESLRPRHETAVAEAAQAAGYADIYDKRLITLTAMERLMGKKTFNEVLDGLVVKPVGKPTLVPESDKRPALDIHSAQTEFTKTESR